MFNFWLFQCFRPSLVVYQRRPWVFPVCLVKTILLYCLELLSNCNLVSSSFFLNDLLLNHVAWKGVLKKYIDSGIVYFFFKLCWVCRIREGLKKVIFITLGSDPPPPLKRDNHFFGNYTNFWALLEKSVFFPLKIPKHFEKFQKIGVGNAKCHAPQGPRGPPLPQYLKKL